MQEGCGEDQVILGHAAAQDHDGQDAVPAVPPAGIHALLDELDRAERAVASGISPGDALRRARMLAEELATGPVRPAPPTPLRPVPAVRAELDRAVRALGAGGGVVTMGTERVLDPDVGSRVLEIVRSVLDNVVRHSGAETVRVGLAFDTGAVRLLVEDDGCGFDPAAVTHSGLAGAAAGVRERGGEFEVDSTPGWGTRIRARLPEPPLAPPGPAAVSDATAVFVPAGVPDSAAASGPADAPATEPFAPLPADASAAADPAGAVEREAARLGSALSGGALPGGAPPGDTRSRSAPPGNAGPGRPTRGNAALTLREREVRALVEQGLPDKQIASLLQISVKTVEKHVGAILRKTGARNRTMLARFGAADGADRT